MEAQDYNPIAPFVKIIRTKSVKACNKALFALK